MSLMIEIKVVPASGRTACKFDPSTGLRMKKLKCYLKSPPEKGKANAELIKMLAKSVGISKDLVSIVSGATSRNKIIKIDAEITFEQLLEKLGIERQMGLF